LSASRGPESARTTSNKSKSTSFLRIPATIAATIRDASTRIPAGVGIRAMSVVMSGRAAQIRFSIRLMAAARMEEASIELFTIACGFTIDYFTSLRREKPADARRIRCVEFPRTQSRRIYTSRAARGCCATFVLDRSLAACLYPCLLDLSLLPDLSSATV